MVGLRALNCLKTFTLTKIDSKQEFMIPSQTQSKTAQHGCPKCYVFVA